MGIREARDDETIERAEFVYRNIGPVMVHNYYCAVCREQPAVINCNTGVLQPCWVCQGDGWEIRQRKSWFRRFFR